MSLLTRAQWEALYGTTGTEFPDNTTGLISELKMRTFGKNGSDSLLFRSDDLVDEDDMASNSATKVPSQQSVKAYVDAAALGIVTSWKAPVVNATTANITLSGEQTIDGVLTSASRILVKNQSTQSENGIYVTAAGAWARSSDANAAAELEGAAVTVQQGTANANTTWIQTTDGITLGSSNIVFAQLGSSVPDADETTKGIIEIATQAETNTGTDDVRALTPLKAATRYAPLASPALTGTPTVNGESVSPGLEVISTTGTAIAFAVPQFYASAGTPATGNVTLVTTGLVPGMVQVLYHDDSSEPTFPAEFSRLSGFYVTNTLNIIYMHAITTTRIEYMIFQEL